MSIKESQQALDELIAKDGQAFAYEIANVYSWRREKDRAFEWLERAYKARDADLAMIKTEDTLKPWHADPRYCTR